MVFRKKKTRSHKTYFLRSRNSFVLLLFGSLIIAEFFMMHDLYSGRLVSIYSKRISSHIYFWYDEYNSSLKFEHDYSGSEDDITESLDSWYVPGTKYFAFQPSGGISNQRKILEWGVITAKLLNRTVIIPPVASHTSKFGNYNNQKYEDVTPISNVIEIERLRKYVPVVVIQGMTLRKFLWQFRNKHGVSWQTIERNSIREKVVDQWDSQKILDMFGKDDVPVLYFGQGTMWRTFNFTETEISQVQKHVRFHEKLRNAARILSGHLSQKYNCLHIRFSDGDERLLFRKNLLRPASSFLLRMKQADFSKETKSLYIATVPKKHKSPYFTRIRQEYNVTFSRDLPRELLMSVLEEYPLKLRETILAVIEQMICARANKFIGTGFSTLSAHIETLRRRPELME